MINPFTLMTPAFINAYEKRKTFHLVIQNFTLENNLFRQADKKYVLVSHYADKQKALEHYIKIKNDAHSNLIDLSMPFQKEGFSRMLEKDSEYIMYSVLADLDTAKKAIDKQLKYKIQKYLTSKNWHIPRDYKMVPDLELQFGILHVIFGFPNHRIKVPLSELENYT
jgi:hypothetical protein